MSVSTNGSSLYLSMLCWITETLHLYVCGCNFTMRSFPWIKFAKIVKSNRENLPSTNCQQVSSSDCTSALHLLTLKNCFPAKTFEFWTLRARNNQNKTYPCRRARYHQPSAVKDKLQTVPHKYCKIELWTFYLVKVNLMIVISSICDNQTLPQ